MTTWLSESVEEATSFAGRRPRAPREVFGRPESCKYERRKLKEASVCKRKGSFLQRVWNARACVCVHRLRPTSIRLKRSSVSYITTFLSKNDTLRVRPLKGLSS